MDKKLGIAIIRAGDQELTLLFNNFSLGEAEKDLGVGIPGVLRGYDESGKSGVREVSVLIQHGRNEARVVLRDGGKRITYREATRILDEYGFVNVVGTIFEAIGEVISYNPNEENETDLDSDEFDDESKNA